MWNLEDQYFEDNRAIFFGEKSKAKKTITFAVSAANTSYDAFKKHVEIIDDLKKWTQSLFEINIQARL